MSTKRFALNGEFYVPAVLAIITVVYLISALQLGPPMKDGNMTASFFPILTAVVMLIALVCAMVQALGRKPSDDNEKPGVEATETRTSPTRKNYAGLSLGAVGVILLTAGYLWAFDLLGYFTSTFIYVLLLHGLFGGSIKEKWLMKLVATLCITVAGYLLFEVFFQVRLPTLWSQS